MYIDIIFKFHNHWSIEKKKKKQFLDSMKLKQDHYQNKPFLAKRDYENWSTCSKIMHGWTYIKKYVYVCMYTHTQTNSVTSFAESL